jgi:cysteinyl-tRNA synthetase
VKNRTSSLSSEPSLVRGSRGRLPSQECMVTTNPNRSSPTGEWPRTIHFGHPTGNWPAHTCILSLEKAQADFRAALCDSFNTPIALDVLRDIVSKTNVYINSSGKALNVSAVTRVARWVGDMLRMFGLGEGPRLEGDIGWGQDRSSSLDDVAVSLRT